MSNKPKKIVDYKVAWHEISTLDFTMQKNKMQKKDGENWSKEKLDIVEEQYKRMLLMLKHHATALAPSKDVDVFWHYHILDTQKYHEDCQRIFGYYVHHDPYAGGTESLSNTLELYEKEFKEPLYAIEETYIAVS